MPYRNFFKLWLIFLCFILPAGKVWAQDPFKNSVQDGKIISDVDGKRYITAIRTDVPLKIDGSLNEPAWSNAQFAGQFTQREPVEGAPASEKTEVGFLYDQKNLYIGIKYYDSEADKIIAREMRRDALVDDDDYFEFVLVTLQYKYSKGKRVHRL